GKSSLINAILGQRVAAVGVIPTTATTNRLRWAPDRFVQVDFHDAQRPTRLVEPDALREYLRHEDPAQISSVSIFCPLEALRRLEVIDTPGFNADREDHAAVAVAAAQNAHLLLWVSDVTAPLKASEAKSLLALGRTQIPICVVLNKSDRLNQSELDDVMQHVTAGLAELGITPMVPAFVFSAALAEQAFEGNIPMVEAVG